MDVSTGAVKTRIPQPVAKRQTVTRKGKFFFSDKRKETRNRNTSTTEEKARRENQQPVTTSKSAENC